MKNDRAMPVKLTIRVLILFTGTGVVTATIPWHPTAANSPSISAWGSLPVQTTLKAIQ
jgi:hypothetical protein